MNDLDAQTFRGGSHTRMKCDGYFAHLVCGRVKRFSLAALLLPALMGLAACGDPTERAAGLAQQADAYIQAGNLVAARSAIAEAIALREDEPNYHMLQGVISMRSGDMIGAYRAFNRALEFDQSNPAALAYIGNIGVQIGQLGDAEDAANKLLTLQPNALPALQVKGMIALARDKFEEAMQYGDKILAVDPTDEAGSIVKARAMAKTGQAEEAMKLIDTALVARPDSAALLTNKVNIYRYLGQAEQMAPSLEQLLKLSNGLPSVRLDLINLQYRLGRMDEARKSSLALLSGGSADPEDYRTLQRIWWQYDKAPLPEGAARNASGWKEPLAIVAAVRYMIWRGDLPAAQALIRSAPANAQPLLASLQARLTEASGRKEEARKQVDALLAKEDHDVDALMLRARYATDARQEREALEAAQLAQTNDPQNPETYLVLASVYRSQGADFRVRQVFEDGLKTLPQNFYLLESYVQYLHQSGDKARAISATRAFARALPSSTRAWEIMGQQCQLARDAACMQSAYAGFLAAKKAIIVDDVPGKPQNRGLFGRI